MTITLPIPPRAVRPNGRAHLMVKARYVKRCRQLAKLRTLAAMAPEQPFQPIGYTAAFFFPSRLWDDDNALASLKPYRDGIADAFRMDDRALRLLAIPTMVVARNEPRVEITLHFPTPETA
jgi:hypothetical protein